MKSLILITLLLPLLASPLPKATLTKFKEKAQDPIFLNETYSTGYVNIKDRGDLFYWWFESRNKPSKDPLIIWLTGGPGCSSELALFFENGPFVINKDLTLSTNPYSWNNVANVLYLDQPLGTGFSNFTDASDIVIDEAGIAEDFFIFINEFYKQFPEFEGRDLFIFGESYSGHYIPAISAYLLQNNKNEKIKFKGVAIGNGLVSAYWQYPQYAEYAMENQLITDKQYQYSKLAFLACQKLMDKGAPFAVYFVVCNAALTYITGNPPRFNIYDISRPCIGRMCYDFSRIDDFLAQPKVIEALGTGKNQWEECNMLVYQALLQDWFVDQSPNVAYLLSKKLPVLIYSGDLDFICNWFGGKEWTNQLEWPHKSEFNNAELKNVTGYGLSKSVEGFTFYRIFKAGHMVPMDKPTAGLDMVIRFLKNQRLNDEEEQENDTEISDEY